MKRKKKTKLSSGFYLTWRKIWDHPVASRPAYFAVFSYIVSHANFTPRQIIIKNKTITIKRGQYIGSLRKIARQFDLSIGTASYILKWLKAEHLVEHKAMGVYSLFTVYNYNRYQKVEHKVETSLNTHKSLIETTNNDKHYNNDKKERRASFKKQKYLIDEKLLANDYRNKSFSKYNISFTDLKRKAEELYDYCQAKGKRYVNYRSLLKKAIAKDFGYRFNK